MPLLPVFATTSTLLGTQLVTQMFSVIGVRRSEKVAFGEGDSKLLKLRIRGHSNFTENVPFCLLLLLGAELQGTDVRILSCLSGLLVVSRWMHAYGFMYEHPPTTHFFYRVWGTVGTISYIGASSMALLLHNINGIVHF